MEVWRLPPLLPPPFAAELRSHKEAFAFNLDELRMFDGKSLLYLFVYLAAIRSAARTT
jgi:hypothetical protein